MQLGLRLSKDQETEILNARKRMLNRLLALVDQRKSIISRLGLQMLQTGRVRINQPDLLQSLFVPKMPIAGIEEAQANFCIKKATRVLQSMILPEDFSSSSLI